jgi:hypothetical protein
MPRTSGHQRTPGDTGPGIINDSTPSRKWRWFRRAPWNILGDAEVIGRDTHDNVARHGYAETDSQADAHLHNFVDLDTDAEAIIIHYVASDIYTGPASQLETRDLSVRSEIAGQRFFERTDDHTDLPGGDRRTYARGLSDTDVQFNSHVTVPQRPAVLVVNSAGTVVESLGVEHQVTGSEVIVNGLTSTGVGNIEFSMTNAQPTTNGEGDLEQFAQDRNIRGEPRIDYHTGPSDVLIRNVSSKNLRINNLGPASGAVQAVIRFTNDLATIQIPAIPPFIPATTLYPWNTLINSLTAPNSSAFFPTTGSPAQPLFTKDTNAVHFVARPAEPTTFRTPAADRFCLPARSTIRRAPRSSPAARPSRTPAPAR